VIDTSCISQIAARSHITSWDSRTEGLILSEFEYKRGLAVNYSSTTSPPEGSILPKHPQKHS
jgi:hypothetical protein